jgi:sugar O-acyltransferase (sialic acid O-acetyltransferase NeuD family)
MKKRDLIIFGTSAIAQIVREYFDEDSSYRVMAFVVDQNYCDQESIFGLPLFPFETIETRFPPKDFDLFIATGYSKMNKFRESKYNRAKELGYTMARYVSSKCTFMSKYPIGDNSFIFEDNTVQPYVKIGSNVILWSGNHIGHHSIIGDHIFISSHVVVSGHCEIRNNCFIGVNASIHNNVILESDTLIGAGVVVSKSTSKGDVYVPSRSHLLSKKSWDVEI